MAARRTWLLPLVAIALLATVAAVGPASGRPLPSAPQCRLFPRDNHWNLRVDRLPLVRNSRGIVGGIGAGGSLFADFGSGTFEGRPIGIPYTTVSGRQRRVPVRFAYADESDRGSYPIPPIAPVEGGRSSDGDRHVIVVDRDRCRLYEIYRAFPRNGGRSWNADSGAIWSLGSNRMRPKYWTSADAAGLPILPGLVRYDEVKAGRIDHALRFTAPRTRRRFIYPARHYASQSRDPNLPAMGERLRLRRGYDISGFSPSNRVILTALKRYGMIVADNGSRWFLSGAPHSKWNNDGLKELGRVKGSDFEVVDTSRLPRPRSR
jgi:hypothetical protein